MQADENATVIPLVEEQVRLQKRVVPSETVKVSIVAETRTQVVSAPVQEQKAEVRRVSIDRVVDVAPPIRTEGDVTIIPVLEEVLVVEKRLILKEEIHIRRFTETKEAELSVTTREEHAAVETISPIENQGVLK